MARPLLSEKVADKIKQMIIHGELPTGEQIPSEQELSQRLNVSVRTVREAVKALVSCNILEIQRGIGTFTCADPGLGDDPFGFEFMDTNALYPDLVEIRLILEPEIFVLAAHRGTQAEFEAAAAVLEQVCIANEKLGQGDNADELIERFWTYDMQFHQLIYQASHNAVANRMLPLITKTLYQLYRSELFRKWRKSKNFYSRHQMIFEAVLRKNDEEIRKLCRAHISSGTTEGGLL